MKQPVVLALILALALPVVIADAKECPDGTVVPDDSICLNLDYPQFGGFDLKDNQSLQGLIAWLYFFIVGISGIAAFVMLVWGGIQWMSSAGNPTAIGDAKDRIQKALLGLLLVLSSFIIIQIINPELTILKSPFPETSGSPPGGRGGGTASTQQQLSVDLVLLIDGTPCATSATDDACELRSGEWAQRTFSWQSAGTACRGLGILSDYIPDSSPPNGFVSDTEGRELVSGSQSYRYTLECTDSSGRSGRDTVSVSFFF